MFTEIALCILIMAFLARVAGGGIIPTPPPWEHLPEFFFAAAFGLVSFHAVPSLVLAGLSLAWSFCWMETGHATAFDMGRNPQLALGGRKEFLSPVIDALCRATGHPLGGLFYCWTFMGLKGFLIGLPAFPFGLLLAILWPLGYELGRRAHDWGWWKDVGLSEWLSGAAAGLVIGLALVA